MCLMTYTGDVTSGGPSDRRDLRLLTIRDTDGNDRLIEAARVIESAQATQP